MNTTIMTGLIDFFRSGSIADGFKESNERATYASGVDFATCNGVIEKNGTNLTQQDIDETVKFFNSKNLPFMWWTDDPILSASGFQFGGIMKGIVLDANSQLPKPPVAPVGLKIKSVSNSQEIATFTQIIASCFGFSPEVEQQYSKVNQTTMDRKEQIHFLAYENEIPVATASLSILPQSAGIWNCATLPEYRKKGFGTSLCYTAFLEAKKRNYSQVMAILMPKGLAWGLFQSLGYKEVNQLPFYIYGASSHDLEK